jgi:putative transposase
MPWRAEKVENTRYQFILEAQKRRQTFIELCQAFSISAKTGYKWLRRFEEDGKTGLLDQNRNPENRPGDTSDELKHLIIKKRLQHPCWGAKKLRPLLEKEHPCVDWPSVTTFGNILKREGLTTKRRRRLRMAQTGPLKDCTRPNQVWSIDFKGWWETMDGSICEPLTITDNYSRFIFYSRHVPKKTMKQTWEPLEAVFQEFGMPERIRSDNGPPFATTSMGRLSRMAIKLIRLGVTPEWIAPGKPQENGRHERMHRTLKQEVATPPSPSLSSQQISLDTFRHNYNYVRPHEALTMQTPANVHVLSPRKWTGEERSPIYLPDDETRGVDKRGQVGWNGKRFFTSEILWGEQVGIRWVEEDTFAVYYGPVLLGHVNSRAVFIRA